MNLWLHLAAVAGVLAAAIALLAAVIAWLSRPDDQ